ncbi:MAG: acyl-CoA thioesterase [Gammaproteobacteria bacterium]|nr:acyl-CoA thioesterase [Gammaproteobacteria bacterium]MCB1851119.1 acyl-CoA thioesterase [Gammaproteobacteria bacterium]MCP5417074.1 acyl-CoA thioesterase [Chromatiaceae bacterium]
MFRETIQPRFSETNAVGHVGFTVLPAWFEKAMESVYRLFVPDLASERWNLIVVKFEMECLAEIGHRQEVTIETQVEKIGGSSFRLGQALIQNGKIAARAETTLVYFDYREKKALPLDDRLRAALQQHIVVR